MTNSVYDRNNITRAAALLTYEFNQNLERPYEEFGPEYRRVENLARAVLRKRPQAARVLLRSEFVAAYRPKLEWFVQEEIQDKGEDLLPLGWVGLWLALVQPTAFVEYLAEEK